MTQVTKINLEMALSFANIEFNMCPTWETKEGILKTAQKLTTEEADWVILNNAMQFLNSELTPEFKELVYEHEKYAKSGDINDVALKAKYPTVFN